MPCRRWWCRLVCKKVFFLLSFFSFGDFCFSLLFKNFKRKKQTKQFKMFLDSLQQRLKVSISAWTECGPSVQSFIRPSSPTSGISSVSSWPPTYPNGSPFTWWHPHCSPTPACEPASAHLQPGGELTGGMSTSIPAHELRFFIRVECSLQTKVAL